MILSKIDGTKCKNNLGLSIHLKKYGITLLEYYEKYENFEPPKCMICGSNTKHRQGIEFRKTCGNKTCLIELGKQNVNNNPNSVKNSKEIKEKIRKSRIKYLKKTRGKDSAWERRSRGKMSKGEGILHDIFEKNNVYQKYVVVNEYCEYPYFIDFAFINEKVAVEYDGRCHFKYGNKRVEHDYKKDEELKKKGWRVYRIPYFEIGIFNLSDLISFIGEPKEKENFNVLLKYKDFVTKKINKKYYCECGSVKYKKSENCAQCSSKKRRKVVRPDYSTLKNDIDELGYVGVGKKYGVSDNAVRKWLKNYS